MDQILDNLSESIMDTVSFGIDELAVLMNQTANPTLRNSFFQTSRCKILLKALLGFVSTAPLNCVANLFKENTDPIAFDIHIRDWPYIFHHFLGLQGNGTTLLYEDSESLIRIGTVLMRQVMRGLEQDENPNHFVGVIIGFWIAKLYAVKSCMGKVKLSMFPEPIREAYKEFICWKGEGWHFQPPTLPFNDPYYLLNTFVTEDMFPLAAGKPMVRNNDKEVTKSMQYAVAIVMVSKNSSALDKGKNGLRRRQNDQVAVRHDLSAKEFLECDSTNFAGKRKFDSDTYMLAIPDEHLPLKKRRSIRNQVFSKTLI